MKVVKNAAVKTEVARQNFEKIWYDAAFLFLLDYYRKLIVHQKQHYALNAGSEVVKSHFSCSEYFPSFLRSRLFIFLFYKKMTYFLS